MFNVLLRADVTKCVAVAAGLASAIWTLHRGETVIAQLEAARAQQAAEAACIGLTLDEEKITSLSASTRRHLQGLALVVQVKPCTICASTLPLLSTAASKLPSAV